MNITQLSEADGVKFANYIVHFGEYAKAGMTNILHNPFALFCFVAGIVLYLLFKRIKGIIWGVIMLFVLGYGSLVIDGARLAVDVIDKVAK